MTIYKPNNPERKQEKSTKVVIEDKQPLTEKTEGNDALLFRRPITNTEVLRRRRRIRCAMIMLLMLLVVAMALVTALLFNSRTLGYMPNYTGECNIMYHEKLPGDAQALIGGSFKETYEIDGVSHERLDVPPVLNFRRSTVLHDFDQNLTAIVDRDNERCFILPLNRGTVEPPKNFLDLLDKFKSGYYLPDAEIVRDTYKVVLPPMRNVEQLGYYIWSDCQLFTTYRLVKALESHVADRKKRSAECSMIGDGFCLGATLSSKMTCLSFADCTH